jgi:hypothetical protein
MQNSEVVCVSYDDRRGDKVSGHGVPKVPRHEVHKVSDLERSQDKTKTGVCRWN